MAKAKKVLGWVGWLAAIIFFALSIRRLLINNDWQSILVSANYTTLGLAYCLMVAGMFAWGLSGYFSLKGMAHPITIVQSYRYWYLSQLSKYIPGGVWQFAMRAAFYTRSGASLALSTVLPVWEQLIIVLSGALVIGMMGLVVQAELAILWVVLLIGTGGTLLLMLRPAFWQAINRFDLSLIHKIHAALSAHDQHGKTTANLIGLDIIGWLLINTGFHFILRALGPETTVPWMQSAFVFSLAWIVGFFVIIAPSGLGPREAVIIFLLSPYIGDSLAISLALVARLGWITAEGLHIALVSLLGIRLKEATNEPG